MHGRSITADNIGALMPVSNLEAMPATRLFEMWFEQHMFDGCLAVKVGQLAADIYPHKLFVFFEWHLGLALNCRR